jgi:hypothetical protein
VPAADRRATAGAAVSVVPFGPLTRISRRVGAYG